MDNQTLKNFWDNCPEDFAHIVKPENREDYYVILKKILKSSNFDFKDKVVVDYGTGNAQLYKLLKDFGCKKYIGIDISNRSLKEARKYIKKLGNEIPYSLMEPPETFYELNADVFISLATIQHFPNEEYCLNFFNKLNNSGIKELFIQIRYGDDIKFEDDYTDIVNVTFSTYLNYEFLEKYLNNYNLLWKSEVSGNKGKRKRGNYSYSTWVIKDK